VPYIGSADLDRPISFGSGYLYCSYGGGAFRLAPNRCGVRTSDTGQVDFQLDLIRALDDRDSGAVLMCTLGAEYAGQEALSRVREIDATASLMSCVLTNWWFRVLPSAVLGTPVELAEPAMIASNGLGTARIMARLTLETGLLLESLLTSRAPLAAVAEAQFEGVSARLPVAVRFEPAAVIGDLLKRADAAGALPRQAIVDYFGQDPSTLPLRIDGTLDAAWLPRFADAMTDRLVRQCGRYVPSLVMADAPVVQLDTGLNGSLLWTLSQPFVAARRVVMPVSLLAAAQAQIERLGAGSVIRRTTVTSLPPLGLERIVALCNLPASRAGVDALGVTVTFPPHPPERPQPTTVTGLFEPGDDTTALDVRLSPGEPVRYRYSAFAVLTDERGTRQVDGPEIEGSGSPLHLSTDEFPLEFAVIEVTPSLGELAIVAGVCTYELSGESHEQKFTLDSGNLTTAFAVPRSRSSLTIDGYAIAREGTGRLRIGPIESPRVRLDVTSFPTYGPHTVEVRCVFDDSATLRAVSLLPADREAAAENITTISFTPAEPVRSFQWSARSPFAAGLRYRGFGAPQAAWVDVTAGSTLVLHSSQLRNQERQRARLETVEAGPAAPESVVEAVGVSPSYDVSDLLLFESVSDPAKKLYVPRYEPDVQTVSGQDRYRISMSQHDGTSTLEVNLVAAPDTSLAEQARGASVYPHRVVVVLDFLVAASSGARKSLEFTAITRTENLVRATLTFATLAERDDVYRALTEQARDARLVVQRYLDVRVPERPPSGDGHGRFTHLLDLPLRPILATRLVVTPPSPNPVAMPAAFTAVTPAVLATGIAMRSRVERTPVQVREVSAGVLAARIRSDVVFRPIGRFVAALPVPQVSCAGKTVENGMTRCALSVTNWADFSDDFFVASPDLPPCGLNTSASRTWVDIVDAGTNARLYGFCALGAARQLSELWFAVPSGQAVPARVSVTLTDRRARVERRSNAVETSTPEPPAPATRDVRIQLDQTVAPAPFAFPPALHGYIFQGATPTTGSNQLIRSRFPWKGAFHTYLQDASRPRVVYVFADEFKIARRPDAPYSPFATVRVSSRPDASDTDVVFDYVVAPYTDPKRLDDARQQLLADPRFGADTVEFQPFLTTDVRFFVERPAAAGVVREQRTGASVVLQGALKDTLTMSLGDFRLLFDAMHRRTAALFLGHLEIDVPNDVTESVPFSARMDDLAGEVFSYDEEILADGTVRITARNEIESPLSVQTIDASVTLGRERRRGVVQSTALPCASLLPGGTIQFAVTPEGPPVASATPEVALDLGGVTAIPDPEAIWNSILDRTTVDCFKIVTVKAIKTLFDPVAGREADQIVSILLEFEGGGTGELNAGVLEAKVRVDYPVDDVMLGRPVSSAYRYTVTVIRADGHQDRDGAPRESSSATFFVSVVR
jgi:hypothetical protein